LCSNNKISPVVLGVEMIENPNKHTQTNAEQKTTTEKEPKEEVDAP